MNLDLQNKDISIKNLIEYLLQKYGSRFKTKDHWDGDSFAIGLTDLSGIYLVYISTIGLDKSGYFISLENPSNDKDFPYEPAGEFDNLNLSELEKIFIEHLRIK